MGQRRTNETKVEKRRAVVASLYLKARSLRQIAVEVGCHHVTVHRDLEAIREEWREQRNQDYGDAIAIALAKNDQLEAVAWDAWERSKEDAVTEKTGQNGKFRIDTTTTTGQVGDPRFLAQVDKCIQTRREILGLDKVRDIPVDMKGRVTIQAAVEAVRNDPRLPDFIQARGGDDYPGSIRQGSRPGEMGNGSPSNRGESNGNGNGNGAH